MTVLTWIMLYLAAGVVFRYATSWMVKQDRTWEQSSTAFKIARTVLFPVQTIIYWVRPFGGMSPDIKRSKADYGGLFIFADQPNIYCIFCWGVTVFMLIGMGALAAVSAIIAPFLSK